jgi:hypothetical protein
VRRPVTPLILPLFTRHSSHSYVKEHALPNVQIQPAFLWGRDFHHTPSFGSKEPWGKSHTVSKNQVEFRAPEFRAGRQTEFTEFSELISDVFLIPLILLILSPLVSERPDKIAALKACKQADF